jgi:O-antigen/teichoic acid export membrane protein
MGFVKRTSKGFFWNQISKISDFGLIFLFSVVVARGLGSEQYGIYSIVISVCTAFLLFCSLGFNEAANNFIPKFLEENKKTAYLLKKLIWIRSLITFILSLVLYFCSGVIANVINNPRSSEYLKLAILYVIFESLSTLLMYIFIGQLRTKLIFQVKFLARLLNVSLAYVFLRQGFGITGLIYMLSCTSFLSMMVYLFRLKANIFQSSEKFDLRPIYKFSKTLWLTGFINFVLNKQIDILLLSFFLIRTNEIGYYNIAFTLSVALSTLLLGGLEGITLSSLSEIEAKHDRKALELGWRIIIKIAVFLSVPITVFAIYFAKPIIAFFYSEAYLPAAILFQVFASYGLINRLLGGGTHVTVLYAVGRERLAFWLRLSAALLNLILDILLIPIFGVMGAIIATGSSCLIIMILELNIVKSYLQGKYPVMILNKIVLISLLSLGVVAFIPIVNIYSLIMTGLVYGITGIGLLYLLKPLSSEEMQLLLRVDIKLYKIFVNFSRQKDAKLA